MSTRTSPTRRKTKPERVDAPRVIVDPLMTPAEVGAILKLSESAVIKRSSRGLIPSLGAAG